MISAILLAAGRGARAWPYSVVRQKATLPVLDTPIVRRLVLDLIALGVPDVIVVVGYGAASVKNCLADLAQVRFVEQRQPSGSADAALTGLAAATTDEVAVCSGDIVVAETDLRRLFEAHASNGGQATLLSAPKLPSMSMGFVVDSGGGVVSGVRAMSGAKCTGAVFAGVSVAKCDCLRHYLLKNPGIVTSSGGAMPPVEAELCCTLDMMAQETGEVGVVGSKKPVVDVDKPWQLAEANVVAGNWALASLGQALTVGEGASISDKAEVRDGLKLCLGRGARIGDHCSIQCPVILADGAALLHGAYTGPGSGSVFLGENGLIADFACVESRSVVGPGSVIARGADFFGVAFDGVNIGQHARLRAMLGSKVDAAPGITMPDRAFDDAVRPQVTGRHRERPETFGELAYVGDYARLGAGSIFAPGVKVGSYACIGSGVVVNEDVPDKKLVAVKQELELREWGPEVYGW